MSRIWSLEPGCPPTKASWDIWKSLFLGKIQYDGGGGILESSEGQYMITVTKKKKNSVWFGKNPVWFDKNPVWFGKNPVWFGKKIK